MKKHGFLDSRQVNLTIAESGRLLFPQDTKGMIPPSPPPFSLPALSLSTKGQQAKSVRGRRHPSFLSVSSFFLLHSFIFLTFPRLFPPFVFTTWPQLCLPCHRMCFCIRTLHSWYVNTILIVMESPKKKGIIVRINNLLVLIISSIFTRKFKYVNSKMKKFSLVVQNVKSFLYFSILIVLKIILLSSSFQIKFSLV